MTSRDATPVAVTSRSFSRNEVLRSELLERYAQVTFNDGGDSLSGDQLVAFLSGHPLAITALETIDEYVLARLPELTTISKVGVGIDMLDLGAMDRHGVRLAWQGGTNARSVSELTLGLMLALLRHISALDRSVRASIWQQVSGRTLTDRTVGIIGFGHVGRDLAALLSGFSCRLLVYDVRPITDWPPYVEPVDLGSLFGDSDIVSLHVPLSEETRHIVDREQLARMRPGALVINTARGGLVDEEALYDSLRGGALGGAALDVFSVEPPINSPLLQLDAVIATPHIGGSTAEAVLAMGRAAIAGLSCPRPAADLM